MEREEEDIWGELKNLRKTEFFLLRDIMPNILVLSIFAVEYSTILLFFFGLFGFRALSEGMLFSSFATSQTVHFSKPRRKFSID
jgi:hypothetical protein